MAEPFPTFEHLPGAWPGQGNGLIPSEGDSLPSTNGPAGEARQASRAAEADPWNQQIDDLLALRALEEDWDGLGARAPSPELVDSALLLAQLYRQQGVEAPSRVVPGVNGTVILEWQSGGAYCEVEVVKPDRAEGLLIAPGQPAKHWLITGEEGAGGRAGAWDNPSR